MTQLNKMFTVIIATIACTLMTSMVNANTLELEPTKDTFISPNYTSVQGSNDYILVEKINGDSSYAHIYFNVSSLPSSVNVTDAKLRLTQKDTASNPACRIELSRDSVAWREDEAYLGGLSSGDLTTTVSTLVISESTNQWDATSYVRNWISGTYENNGLSLNTFQEPCSKRFYSREATTASNRPKLIITYTPAPTPTPIPTPTPTPTPSPTPKPSATAKPSPSPTLSPTPSPSPETISAITATPLPTNPPKSNGIASSILPIGMIIIGIVIVAGAMYYGYRRFSKTQDFQENIIDHEVIPKINLNHPEEPTETNETPFPPST